MTKRTCTSDDSIDQSLRRIGWTKVTRRPELGPCWEWAGRIERYGYGRLGGALAHRLAYIAWVGPLDSGQQVCHRCDNPPCIAPTHLFTGTNADNVADMLAKQRSRNGERHPDVKLTDADVAAIRGAYTGAWGQQTRLAEQYGVNPKTISRIVRGLERTATTHLPERT